MPPLNETKQIVLDCLQEIVKNTQVTILYMIIYIQLFLNSLSRKLDIIYNTQCFSLLFFSYLITFLCFLFLQNFPRIERELFPEMADHPNLYLLSVSWEENTVQNLVSHVVEVLDKNTVGPMKYIRYAVGFFNNICYSIL